MVLGLGSKKKGTTVKVEFQIQVHEVKPWNLEAASRPNTPLQVQWQRGENRSGKTKSVVPKQEDGGKLVFNETFKLPAKLVREAEGKGRNAGIARFQKKTVVFIVQEARTDVPLARCVVDLAEYADLDSRVPASIPLAVGKKAAMERGQKPVLYLTIGPLERKEERSFASRVSFGSSTPRSSISRAPEKGVGSSSKSKSEPDLDEETRKSIVASLMSDDDDNVSIESFTDDEDTPGSATPRSDKIPKSTMPRFEISKASTTPPRSEAPKTSTSTSIPEADRKSVNTSSSSSSFPQSAIQTSTEGPAPIFSPVHGRPIPIKHGPGPAKQSSASLVAEESADSSRLGAAKLVSGKSTESSATSPDDSSRSSRAALTPTESITQLFSTDPVYKSTKGAQDVASESVSRQSKDLSNDSNSLSESGSQPSKSIKRPPSLEQRDEVSRAALFSTETTNSSSSKFSKSSSTSSETPRGVANKLTDLTGSSSSSLESQTAHEIAGSEHAKSPNANVSPEKELPQKSAASLPPASAKAAAAAAASAYVARKTFRPSRGSSFDAYESSEDLLSESSNGGRSPAGTPVRDQPQASGRSTLSPESPVDAKRSENEGGNRKIEIEIVLPKDKEQVGSESVGRKSPDLKVDVRDIGGASKSPDRNMDFKAISGGSKSPDLKVDVKNIGGGSKGPDRDLDVKNIGIGSRSPDLSKDVKTVGGSSKSRDVQKDIGDEHEATGESVVKQEQPVEETTSVLSSVRATSPNPKVEKRALEELRTKIANVEAKLLAESQKVDKLEGELRDIGAMEVSLYCVVAEHGNSSHKLHTPARRLARLYMHACKHWSLERRAGTAKNSVSGLVTVAKSCGTDVSRLSFWWSNVVALRTVITQAFDTGSSTASPVGNLNGNGTIGWAKARRSLSRPSFSRQVSRQITSSPKPPSTDWKEASTYIAALEKIEEWIYSKIVESLWWQAMIPRMQKNVDASTPTSPKGIAILSPNAIFGSEFTTKAREDLSKLAGDVSGIFSKKQPGRLSVSLPELGDARQGNMSVEVWKKAIMEALRRLCPVRGAGHDCGCLPMLVRMAIEGCVARLDVALFNAILREPDDDVPTDPFSDPVSDSSVLPISPGGLTFGGGSQLKNVVVTWSTFIAGLVSIKEPVFVPDVENGDIVEGSEDSEKSPKFFNLIKATGDLLMLPKDILMDRAIRKEICPMLSLPLIRRILVNFVPDEFAPDPISPSLLAALNAEASIEKQRHGEADDMSSSAPMAAAPSITYVAPSAYYVWSWIGEASTDPTGWGRSNNSLLRKGYTSDEDLSVMEQLQKSSASDKLEFLMGNSMQGSVFTANGNHPEQSSAKRSQSVTETTGAYRFELLEEVWGSS